MRQLTGQLGSSVSIRCKEGEPWGLVFHQQGFIQDVGCQILPGTHRQRLGSVVVALGVGLSMISIGMICRNG